MFYILEEKNGKVLIWAGPFTNRKLAISCCDDNQYTLDAKTIKKIHPELRRNL